MHTPVAFCILIFPLILMSFSLLSQKPFFSNFGAIVTFAILGTFIASVVTGVLVYLGGLMYLMYRLPFVECLVFGALISATDPVTVLSIFQELGTDMNLYALVFGESVLNDAMAISLYRTMSLVRSHVSSGQNFFMVIVRFLETFVGSMSAAFYEEKDDIEIVEEVKEELENPFHHDDVVNLVEEEIVVKDPIYDKYSVEDDIVEEIEFINESPSIEQPNFQIPFTVDDQGENTLLVKGENLEEVSDVDLERNTALESPLILKEGIQELRYVIDLQKYFGEKDVDAKELRRKNVVLISLQRICFVNFGLFDRAIYTYSSHDLLPILYFYVLLITITKMLSMFCRCWSWIYFGSNILPNQSFIFIYHAYTINCKLLLCTLLLVNLNSMNLFKYAGLDIDNLQNLECCLFVLFPYFSYMLAEGLGLSGIVSILFTGIVIKQYTYSNLSENSQRFVSSFFHLISSLAETFIFIYMGFDIAMEKHSWSHVGFIFFSILFIGVARAVNVFSCAYLVNLVRPVHRQIPLKHQKALWYSGLRGAMAFALALQSVHDLPQGHGQIIFTATTAIVVLTVLLIGGSTGTMLEALQVVGDDHDGPLGESFEVNNGYVAPSYNEDGTTGNKLKMKLKEFRKR
ncbi:hypothetical protein CRYUN_Cryun32bG0009300 [Craigia yunnanensis]